MQLHFAGPHHRAQHMHQAAAAAAGGHHMPLPHSAAHRAGRHPSSSSGGSGRVLQQSQPHARSRQHCQTVHAIHIDRRQHLELAWRRQQERDELLKQAASFGKVTEVQDLQHLESLVDKAGSSLLVVFFYTRSCGVCKALLQDYQLLCEEAKSQQVRAVFARHNLLDEFDQWSDISVWHRIRVAPTILFYDEGAVVKKITLHDVRRMGERAGSIREAMQQDLSHMKAIFRQIVFEKAPGARS